MGLAVLLVRPQASDWPVVGAAVCAYWGGFVLVWKLLAPRHRRLFHWSTMLLNIAAATVVVPATGGPSSPMLVLYLFAVLRAGMLEEVPCAMVAATLSIVSVAAVAAPFAVHADPRDAAARVALLYAIGLVVGLSERWRRSVQLRLEDESGRIAQIARAIAAKDDLDQILTLTGESGRHLTGADAGTIILQEDGGPRRVWSEGVSPALGTALDAWFASGDGWRCSGGQASARSDPPGGLGATLGATLRADGLRSVTTLPLVVEGELLGVFSLLFSGDEPQGRATPGELDPLAYHASVAIRQQRLLARERERLDALLQLLAEVIDARERAVMGHSLRVSEYARAVAEHLGLPPREVELVTHAALLHDLGKIAIPDAILVKPGPLDAAERMAMMRHAAMGGAIVGRTRLLASLEPFVRHHHERWDGGGYPDGLSGEEIPLAARIIAVADTLDSITTDRPYHRAETVEAALAEIRRCSGSQFDPRVAEAVAAVVPRPVSAAGAVAGHPAVRTGGRR